MQTVNRLIRSFAPEHYTLSLTLARTQRTFEGTVSIDGTVSDTATTISLHAKDLTISIVLYDGKAAAYEAAQNDEIVITHPDIAPGKHIITVGFSGTITDAMHGLYPCYFDHNGEKKELLATQFESHYAREVFPCVDEPEAKATFDVTLTTDQGITVLGNMPLKNQRVENDQLVSQFERTPRMSTYLLAFVAGELHKKTGTTKSGVEVNIWATPAQPAESLDFALDIATRTIDFFDEYFDTPYPLTKSDHVALPDFSSGAMENWGLITYREVAMLADPNTASLDTRRQVATVVAHELSHQWFGNLVTMKWWNDLWLNESFANMMEYVAIDALQPDWDIWLDHASYEVLQALRRDSLEGVQSIQSDVSHPDEISALFDPSIVYAKGGRLLRMLQTYIGDEAFQQGLAAYFKTYAYKNTEADDLWHCLGEASGRDIAGFMNVWLTQPGYPVVHVSENGSDITLKQDRFFIGPHEPSDSLWPLPLHSSCSEMPEVFADKEVTITRHHTTPLHLNDGATSHFITHYDTPLFECLLESLKTLPAIDRLQLLHDQTLLAQAGIISTAELIPLLDLYADESVEAVWDIMAVAINELKKFVETDEEAEKKLRALVGRLANAQYARLGWIAAEDETEADTKLRSIIISLMLYSERPDVIETALSMYNSTDIAELDPQLRTSIMATAVRQTRPDTVIDDLLSYHQSTSSSELREEIAAALTSTKDIAVIKRLADLFTDQTVVRAQDFSHWFVWLLRNRYGRAYIWQWTLDNWSWIEKTYKGDSHFDSYPRYIGSSLVTQQRRDEYVTFFTPLKKEPALRRNIEIAVKEMDGRIDLLNRDRDAVLRALRQLDV